MLSIHSFTELSKNASVQVLYFVVLIILISCSNIDIKWGPKAFQKRLLFAKSNWWITYLGFVVLQVLMKPLANPMFFKKVTSQIWR